MPCTGHPVLSCVPPHPFWTGTTQGVSFSWHMAGSRGAELTPRGRLCSLLSLDAALTIAGRVARCRARWGVAKNACPLGAAALSQGRGRQASASPAGRGVKNQEDGTQKGQLLPLMGLCLSFREVVRHYGERDTRRGQVGCRLQCLPVPGREGRLLQGRCGLAALIPRPRGLPLGTS